MRKQHEGKGKKIMVYVMGILMVGSIFGVVFFGFGGGGGSGATEYNDFKFINRGNFWTTTINGQETMFTYFPGDVEDIEVNDDIINRLRNVLEIDVTSEVNDTFAKAISLAEFNMGLTLNNFNIFIRQGFAAENEYNFPIITCEDSTDFVPVIYFKSSNETKVYFDRCIIAEAATDRDVERIKDRLVYGLFEII